MPRLPRHPQSAREEKSHEKATKVCRRASLTARSIRCGECAQSCADRAGPPPRRHRATRAASAASTGVRRRFVVTFPGRGSPSAAAARHSSVIAAVVSSLPRRSSYENADAAKFRLLLPGSQSRLSTISLGPTTNAASKPATVDTAADHIRSVSKSSKAGSSAPQIIFDGGNCR